MNKYPKDEILVCPEGKGEFLLVDRVERELRHTVSGLYDIPAAKLPRERSLAQKYGVSIKTVRSALERLKRQNLIQSVRGRGTFVLAPPSKRLTDVLLICSNTYHSYQTVCMGVISNLLKERDYTVNLVMSNDPAQDWARIIQNRSNACGAILISRYPRQTVMHLVRESTIPIVSLSDMDEPVRRPAVCDAVLPDSESQAYRAVEYLARQGHRKIALMGWELSLAAGAEIVQGYRNALAAFGIEYQPEYLLDLTVVPIGDQVINSAPPIQVEEVCRRFNTWVERNDLPTALVHFCASESRIRDLLEHCTHNHFRPGAIVACLYAEQLRTGYGGLSDATAVCISVEYLARQALELLFRERKPNGSYVRNIVEKLILYQRKNGSWTEKEL
jgi:DNA-binding LacI/PurR family transcriptional regulator